MEVCSPNSLIKLTIDVKKSSLGYSVYYKGMKIVNFSKLGFITKKIAFTKPLIKNKEISEVNGSWEPLYGPFSKIKNHYNQLSIEISPEKKKYQNISCFIIFRVYDEGIAFRYEIPKMYQGKISKALSIIKREITECNISDWKNMWHYAQEQDIQGPFTPGVVGKFRFPVLFDNPDSYSICVLESQLCQYSESPLEIDKNNIININCGENTMIQPYLSTWRTLKIGDTPSSLVMSMLPANLNPPTKIEDLSWIRSGKSVWDWRVWGYKTEQGYEYGLNTESHLRFIDFAAENNIQFLLIDADWYGTEFNKNSDPTTAKKEIDIEKCVGYAKEKGIGVILYLNDVGAKKFGAERILKKFSEWGACGVKYGFMKGSDQEKVLWTYKIIKLAAKYKLSIIFHDDPVHPSGDFRTWPHVLAREFGYAQADARRVEMPHNLIGILLLNMNAGFLDLTYGWYGLNEAHNGRHRVFDKIPGTVVAENARVFMINTGLIVLPDAPEEYNKKSDLFQFMKEIGVKWDESKVIDGYPNEFIVMTRRKGDKWFAAALSNETSRILTLDTSFLEKSTTYDGTIFSDCDDSHYLENKEAYNIKKVSVKSGDTLKLNLAPGGGWCAIFTKKKN